MGRRKKRRRFGGLLKERIRRTPGVSTPLELFLRYEAVVLRKLWRPRVKLLPGQYVFVEVHCDGKTHLYRKPRSQRVLWWEATEWRDYALTGRTYDAGY